MILPSAGRQARIRELLSSQSGVSISASARDLSVSEMTIRRDLATLERRARIERTHGGAVLSHQLILEFDYREKRARNSAAKLAIAAEARKLVEPGHRVILDTTTTTLEFACLLRDARDVTVITVSLAVASESMQHAAAVEVILLGGVIRRGSPDLTGPATEHCLDLFAADILFQVADGLGLDGKIYNSDPRLARVDKHMRQVAERCFVLAYHSNIGVTAMVCSGSLAEVDILITSEDDARTIIADSAGWA